MAGLICRHVYENTGFGICLLCAQCTHETNWAETNKLHSQWIADGKADWNKCPQGGTLRGWWSI